MVRVVLDNALARVTVPTTRPSRHFVVSLIDEASTLGPFDGMHIHLRETGLMGAVDMAPLVEVVKKHVEPGRPVTILGSGATVIPALGAQDLLLIRSCRGSRSFMIRPNRNSSVMRMPGVPPVR